MSETGTIVEERLGGYKDDHAVQEPAGDIANPPIQNPIDSIPISEIPRNPVPSSESAPSSPSPVDRIFSSDAPEVDESELSSAPSSPPRLPSPKSTVRKPTFSFLKRKRTTLDDESASEPLADITPNARKIPRLNKQGLTQMHIDLGGEVRKTCRTCGMEYVPSVKEDSALHSKFCAMNVGGVDMGKAFLKDDTVRRIYSERTTGSESEMVVAVDRKSSLAARNRTKRVLDVVSAELSSPDIDDDKLWDSAYPAEKVVGTRRGSSDKTDRRGNRFKAFLHMVGDRCVGLCLSEKISNAFRVIPLGPEGQIEVRTNPRGSSVSISTTPDVALLGISRIWTSKSCRGRGIATNLLDCARMNFFHGVEAPKNLVAFSQPTESGGRLAEHWFDMKAGWHVYRED